MRSVLLCTLALALVACGGSSGTQSPNDSGSGDNDAATDAGDDDAGSSDAGTSDGGPSAGRFFPDGAWMYQDISDAGVNTESKAITDWLANNGSWGTGKLQIDTSIEVLTAVSSTPLLDFQASSDFYSPDCDHVKMPVPVGGNLEGESGYDCTQDGDCHLLVVDGRTNQLFEMWRADFTGGTFNGGCLAVWDMTRVYGPEGRGEQCTSADAAGFPISPLLFTADEVAAGHIDHAIRFILPNARMRKKTYVHPGTHAGGPSATGTAPVYGSRWRLKPGFDMSRLPNEAARTVARALQKYGMALADGGNIAFTARSDQRTTHKWSGLLGSHDLQAIVPGDFEVLDTGTVTTLTFDCTRTPLGVRP
ncbi:MAG: hypothetical protein JST92_06840 [Deltaproteobacteria bacterium]|nr:hypothetical protein [Deltaproteobacteria bacterium]